jgi:hypothetical protein
MQYALQDHRNIIVFVVEMVSRTTLKQNCSGGGSGIKNVKP